MKNNKIPKSLENLRFKITEDMNNDMIEILIIREMLQDKKLKGKERELAEKHFNELREHFISEFKKNNVEERKIYNDFMNK